ncbi:hypothetical protein H206_05366 [Candidatus Electrothrix aarhusensis]|uniref:Uncharacterized protein n=1 Tax=Candidatus Electrothrix aarhusensis TaxID=1859131 RepID=A0A444J4Q3_9BACT|nr:hypothetical protein H206_05366 [Candidatus Electrothrix aarhusensis]
MQKKNRQLYHPGSRTNYKFSSSGGRSVFFAVLHALQQGTRFPLVERPPLDKGMIWSIVNSLTGNLC